MAIMKRFSPGVLTKIRRYIDKKGYTPVVRQPPPKATPTRRRPPSNPGQPMPPNPRPAPIIGRPMLPSTGSQTNVRPLLPNRPLPTTSKPIVGQVVGKRVEPLRAARAAVSATQRSDF